MSSQERAAARRARILAMGERRMALVNGEVKTRDVKEELTAPVDVSDFITPATTAKTATSESTEDGENKTNIKETTTSDESKPKIEAVAKTTTTPAAPSSPSVPSLSIAKSTPTTIISKSPSSPSSARHPDLSKPMINTTTTPYAIQQRYRYWETVLRFALVAFVAIFFCFPIPYSPKLHLSLFILDSPFLSLAWSVLFVELLVTGSFYLLRATNSTLRDENKKEEELLQQHRDKQLRQQREARQSIVPANAALPGSELEASLEKMFSQVDKISGLVDGVGPGASKALVYLGKFMTFQAFLRRIFDAFCFGLCIVVIAKTVLSYF